STKFTDDETARIKFSVHLITYDTTNTFESAKGEAYYKIVLNAFNEELIIPNFIASDIPSKDKVKINKFIQQLKEIKQNPLTWSELYDKETQYLIWYDKVTRRHTKYKN
ncbi:MAG: hypothetical protein J7L46_03760, partial [Bacteroidales bacterium]|nr:hypothetical protein [Bacteroidales bacterium]